MNIGNVKLNNNIMFAPMAGFSDVGFRHLCAKFGAGLTYTEMVSAKGMCFKNTGTAALLESTSIEKPIAVQLFGSDPEIMYRASRDARLEKFDIIDINMGCPVKKVFGNGEGSALMLQPELIAEIVAAVKEGSKKAVTVKMRAGVVLGEMLAVECGVAAEKGGADAVAIHARFRDQFYSGQADHSITRLVKEALHIPVIANGDIVDLKSLELVKQQTNADGFMIGRGALGRPYIFCELQGLPFEFDRKSALYEHIELLKKVLPDAVVANQMKLHICHYAKASTFSKAVRMAVSNAKSLEDITFIVEELFSV